MTDLDQYSVDSFHRGRFYLAQPKSRGHRAGLDAMVLASAVPEGFKGRIVDLGAGAGAAGIAVIARLPETLALLVEHSAEMADFARRSINLPENSALSERIKVLQADVELTGRNRVAAGLQDNSYDFVIMNPPFNAPDDRSSPDELRRYAHVMKIGLMERWIKTASAIGAASAGLAIIARPESLSEILNSLQGRFGNIEIRPVHPRPHENAIRIVIRARKGARGHLKLFPALFLHEETGRDFTTEANGIINGHLSLYQATGPQFK